MNKTSSFSKKELLHYKTNFSNEISKIIKKDIKINTIILQKTSFGNSLIQLSNAIFLCEIISCKEILDNSLTLFIKNPINYTKYNMTIRINNGKRCSDVDVVCLPYSFVFFLSNYNISKSIQRFYVFREEILSNIPITETEPNDLYIHIRSGDIFLRNPGTDYPQPPLCFYKLILDSYKFRKIFIISGSKNNPVIDLLLREYKNIYYISGDISQDISKLINAYYLMIANSSFSLGLAKLSNKLKILFDYDIFPDNSKKLFLIDKNQIYERDYIHIVMKADNEYKSKMHPWKATEEQKRLMIDNKCQSRLMIFYPNSTTKEGVPFFDR